MDNELNQMIEEQNKMEDWSDDDDGLVSVLDFEQFEQRLQTSQSFVREKPQKQQQKQQQQPVSIKDLNSKMQKNLQEKPNIRQPQSKQFSQTQSIPMSAPKPQQQSQSKRKSVDNRGNVKQILEQAQRDNQDLMQKIQILRKQLKNLELENQELKEKKLTSNQSGYLQKSEPSELRLLRIENEELKRILNNQSGDQGRMLQQYGLQIAKLKCKIEDLQQQQQKQQ